MACKESETRYSDPNTECLFFFYPKVLYLRARAKALFSLIGDRGTLIPNRVPFSFVLQPFGTKHPHF